MQTCPDTLDDHYECAMRASRNSYRFAEAEEHFRRALELAGGRPSFSLANVLIYYGSLLMRMGRSEEGIALIERRCTKEQLAAYRADRAAERPAT